MSVSEGSWITMVSHLDRLDAVSTATSRLDGRCNQEAMGARRKSVGFRKQKQISTTTFLASSKSGARESHISEFVPPCGKFRAWVLPALRLSRVYNGAIGV